MHDLRYRVAFVFLSIVVLANSRLVACEPSNNGGPSAGNPLSISSEVKEVRLLKNPPVGEIVFEVSMTIHFKNHSSSPLLLFANDLYPWLGGEYLATSRENALSKEYVFVSEGLLSSDPPTWEGIRRRLNQKLPPMDIIRVIAPGAEWSFDKTLVLGIEIKGSFNKKSKPWDVIKQADPLWLRLMFELWPLNLEADAGNSKYGKELNGRWKEHGRLIIDYVTSEPMPLHLPAN